MFWKPVSKLSEERQPLVEVAHVHPAPLLAQREKTKKATTEIPEAFSKIHEISPHLMDTSTTTS